MACSLLLLFLRIEDNPTSLADLKVKRDAEKLTLRKTEAEFKAKKQEDKDKKEAEGKGRGFKRISWGDGACMGVKCHGHDEMRDLDVSS